MTSSGLPHSNAHHMAPCVVRSDALRPHSPTVTGSVAPICEWPTSPRKAPCKNPMCFWPACTHSFDGGVESGHALSQRMTAGDRPLLCRLGRRCNAASQNNYSRTSARPVEFNYRGERFSLASTERRNVFCDRVLLSKGVKPLHAESNFRRHGDGYYDPRSFVMPVFLLGLTSCKTRQVICPNRINRMSPLCESNSAHGEPKRVPQTRKVFPQNNDRPRH